MLTLDPMADGERGAIVNTASVAAEDGQIGQAAYSASKGGVVGMTLPVARDLASENIRVNTILPGIFDTPLLAGAPQNVSDALGASVLNQKRHGTPEQYSQLRTCITKHDTCDRKIVEYGHRSEDSIAFRMRRYIKKKK